VQKTCAALIDKAAASCGTPNSFHPDIGLESVVMKRKMLAIVWLLYLPLAAYTPPKSVDPLTLLRSRLNRLFSDARLSNAQFGIEVYSLDRSEIVYDKNSSRLLLPASNNKVLTVCTALLRLGPDFRIKTWVLTDGPVDNGVLAGNFIVVGSGDPTNSARFHSGDPFRVFKEWSAKLKSLNVHKITGDIIADEGDSGEMLGSGWEWNDLAEAFAAPVSSLQFNENTVSLEISPGLRKGDPARIRSFPVQDFLKLDNEVVTDGGNSPNIEVHRIDNDELIAVQGTIPRETAALTRLVSVRDPVYYYLVALRNTLSAEGIDVSSCGLKQSKLYGHAGSSRLWIDESPALSEIIKPVLKSSQNLYAETLTRILGSELRNSGTFSKGREIVEETLSRMGLEKGSYFYADGSGLSRLNLVSPDALVRILKYMYRQPEFVLFDGALPIAGVDGTLAGRMKGTKAENNVHAKTGSLADISSISGYVRTSNGEMLAFSMMFNNFLTPKDAVESLQDKALERLANFSRK
jgi:D-alanyl-D-alanine carboxypeptidase/D-alanyl-D-alanine-endopeptidase (penicillin-binding protein 4)